MKIQWKHIQNLAHDNGYYYTDEGDCVDIINLDMTLRIYSRTETEGNYTLEVWFGLHCAEHETMKCENTFEARVNVLWMATEFFHRTYNTVMDVYHGEKLAFFGDL